MSSSEFTVSSITSREMSADSNSDSDSISGTGVASSWLGAFVSWLPSSDYYDNYHYSTAESDGYTTSSNSRNASEEFQKALMAFLEEPANERCVPLQHIFVFLKYSTLVRRE